MKLCENNRLEIDKMSTMWKRCCSVDDSPECVTDISPRKESPVLNEYNDNRDSYIMYAKKLDTFIHETETNTEDIARAMNDMFMDVVDNIEPYTNNVRHVVWVYFIACYWVLDKYCHDRYISGSALARYSRVNIKDLNIAEIIVLKSINFNLRGYLRRSL